MADMADSSSDVYVVVAECAYVTVDTVTGRTKTLVYKGARLTGDLPELEHLLDSGMVAKADDPQAATGGVDTDGNPSGVDVDGDDTSSGTGDAGTEDAGTPPADQGDDERETRRKAARAKLPADGSRPDLRSASDDVLVEWLVVKGYDRAAVESADKTELRRLAKEQASR